MFFLYNDDTTFILNRNGVHRIGRLSGEIVIKDSSISRRHAELRIEGEEAYLRDCNSKYFSRYKGKLLSLDEEVKLASTGQIVFGELTFNFCMEKQIITCSTALKDKEAEIASVIQQLGGKYLKDWNDECTHLTSTEILMTLKVLYALLENKPIVLPEFWMTYLQNIKENKVPPDPSDYVPPLAESILSSKYVEYNPARKHIFNGKIFAFWKKKRLTKMEEVIKKAGGGCILFGKHIEEEKLINLSDKYIVIEPEDTKVEQEFSKFFETYKNKGKRLIPVQELVLAILQCSCNENCNPNFDRVGKVFSKDTQVAGPCRTIVQETESQQCNIDQPQDTPRVVPSSFEDNVCDMLSKSRNNPFKMAAKKLHVQHEVTTPAKRIKLDPDMEIVENPITPMNVIDTTGTTCIQPSTSASTPAKRPSEETVLNPIKRFKEDRPCLRKNPFALMKTEPREEASSPSRDVPESISSERVSRKFNPFRQENIKTENHRNDVTVEENELRTRIPEKPTQIVQPSTRTANRIATVERVTQESSMNNISTSRVFPGTWINCSVNEDVKPNLTMDEEERKWCERFNNTVVIKVADLIRRKERNDTTTSTINSTCSNVKNFKKFRKVPVPKSNVIIKSKLASAPSVLERNNRDI